MRSRPARSGALLLAGLVLAAACGSGREEQAVDGSSTTTTTAPALAPGETTVPGAVSPPPGGVTPPVAPGAPESPPAQPSGPSPDQPGPPGAAGDPAPAPPGAVGSLAARYLRPDGAERVLVQVLAQDGAAPQAAVPERVRQVLAGVSGKPVSVATASVAGGPRSWTAEELRALADGSAPAPTQQQGVLTLLFLRGGFAENDRAVGVAVRGDVAAVFAERVAEAAGTFGSRTAVEDAVTLHEVGHLLGLVDLVVDTGRADPEHPGHSPNRGSVMYYAVESTLLGSILTGGPPRDFDQADLDELARIRNG